MTQSLDRWSFDEYIPFFLANGDFGGNFDPFCGTHYDELRAGGGKTRDIRTLLLSGIRAVDYWHKQVFAPHTVSMNSMAVRLWQEARDAGMGDRTSDVRGNPFSVRIFCDDSEFPAKVTDHQQVFDAQVATVRTQYQFGGRHIQVLTFVHPMESALVYRFEIGAPLVVEIEGMQPTGGEAGPFRFFSGMSNTWCPAALGVWASRGVWKGNRLHLSEGCTDVIFGYGHRRLGVPLTEAKRVVEWAAEAGFERLLESHERWWHDRWERCHIEIPDDAMESIWWLSLYYLICSYPRRVLDGLSGEAGLSASYPAFNTGYHPQDSVMQMLPATVTGMADLCEGSLGWIEIVAPVAREYARSAFWLPGARYVWHGGPGMLPFTTGHSHFGANLYEHHVNGWVAMGIHRYLQAKGWPRDEMRRWLPLLKDLAAFFVGMMSPRGDGWEISYQPVMSQAEVPHTLNTRNLFDVMTAARWTVVAAADVGRRLGAQDETLVLWDEMQSKLRFDLLTTANDGYLPYEGATDMNLKVPSQLTGVWFPILHTLDAKVMKRTADLYERDVRPGSCGFSLPSVSFAQARLGDADAALRHLKALIAPETGFMDERQIMFRECDTTHIPGGLAGRMPYFMAAHGFYAAAVCEMLLQDWTGDPRFFPACPWEEARFRLWANGRCYEAEKKGNESMVRVVDSVGGDAR